MKSIITKSITTKRRAVSAIVGIMLGLGLTAVAAGGLYVMTSDLSDSAVSITSVEIQNARAYNTGDDAYMSMSIKNTGTDAALNLDVVILLSCNAEAGAIIPTATLADKPALELCSSATPILTPGSIKSFQIGTIASLAPGATASVSGTVSIYNSDSLAADTTAKTDSAKLALGQEYIIEVEGATAAGEAIVQSATVRPR